MEAISASEKAIANVPVSDNRSPQTNEDGPPFNNEDESVLARPSHEASSVTDRARMESESNFRCASLN